jgi:hypothetical protein
MQAKWIGDLLLVLYSSLRALCPVTRTVVSSLWTVRVCALFYGVYVFGYVNVNVSKDGCFSNETLSKSFYG